MITDSWWSLADLPSYVEDLAWGPGYQPGAERLRQVVLQVLADHPGTAAAEERTLLDTVIWEAPVLLGRSLTGSIDETPDSDPDDPDGADEAPPDPGEPVAAVLAEAEFLGIVAAGTLSEAGHTLLDGQGSNAVAAALENTLGPAQEDVVLQADLTATVLGHPSGRLTTVLDRMAERESRSAATIWRFGPASIRRALDAGHTGEDLLADLSALTRGEIPQALTYLVHDAARQHGRLRAGSAVSYLRCEDEPLLAEVAADRRLRRHGLRLLAPTVLMSTSTLTDLLTALRSAGYSPVEESPEGATVLRRPAGQPIAPEDDTASGRTETGAVPSGQSGDDPTQPASVDLAALAAQLLREPDRPRRLIDLGQTIIDVEHLDQYIAANEGYELS